MSVLNQPPITIQVNDLTPSAQLIISDRMKREGKDYKTVIIEAIHKGTFPAKYDRIEK